MTTILYILAAVCWVWGLAMMTPGIRLRHWGPIVAGLCLVLGSAAAAVTESWVFLIAAFLITWPIRFIFGDEAQANPLHNAIIRGDADGVGRLLAAGADAEIKNSLGQTPLEVATRLGNPVILALLAKALRDGAASENPSLGTSVYEAAGRDRKANAKGEFDTPLHEAAGEGRKAVVENLIAEGADVNAKGAVGRTPLHWAAEGGHKDVAAYLIAKGADVNANGAVDTPLHGAARRGHTAVVEYLIAEGANVNAKDSGRYTPLHGAAVWGHKDVVACLIAKGADLNAQDHNGLTPLHLAATEGHKDVVELLKKHGARK